MLTWGLLFYLINCRFPMCHFCPHFYPEAVLCSSWTNIPDLSLTPSPSPSTSIFRLFSYCLFFSLCPSRAKKSPLYWTWSCGSWVDTYLFHPPVHHMPLSPQKHRKKKCVSRTQFDILVYPPLYLPPEKCHWVVLLMASPLWILCCPQWGTHLWCVM